MHRQPLGAGDVEIRRPSAAPTATGRQDEIQDKPGDKGRDEGDQASDIHKCIDGYPFHDSILISL